MATPTTSRSSSQVPDANRGRARTVVKTLLVVAVGLLVLAIGSLIGLRVARAGVLPGVTVDGVEVGGHTAEELQSRLTTLANEKASAEIAATREEETYTGEAGELGYAMDVEATAERVMHRGRQGNPVAALSDHLRAFGDETPIEPVESVDDEPLQAWAEDAAAELQLEPQEGGLEFDGADIERVEPSDGALIDADDLAEQARDVLLDGGGGDIPVATEPTEPRTTTADVDDAEERAEQILSAPVTFTRNGAEATLSPEEIGGVLRTKLAEDGEDRAIEIRARPQALAETLGADKIAEFEAEPRSATFEVRGGGVDLIEGREGFTFNPRKASRQLVNVASDDVRSAELRGDTEDPELTTKEAEDLKIEEEVSTFTTHHACCESRVTNIHRIADIVDGVVLEPGETFSVNGFVGERTEEKGFVGGGAIFDGEFVEQIGGGVSQFATTLYNAAYFGGYEIVEHKAHSYYISRYPEGREATLNYPNVDLKIKNNSPHGMLINTSYTDTSITVTMYGTEWVEVDSVTGSRRNFKEPGVQYRENDDLERGEERVIQEKGGPGFDVTVTRILEFPDGETKREEVTTTYLPQPRIIERNT